MLKRNILMAVIAGMGLMAGSAQADVYPKEKFILKDKANAAGGMGVLHGNYAFTRDNAKKDEAIKEVSWLSLDAGSSIGYHKHTTNEDVYVVVSGTGVFRDKDGVDKPVKAGDVTIVRKGESHGLTNTGKVPLVILDVIAEQ